MQHPNIFILLYGNTQFNHHVFILKVFNSHEIHNAQQVTRLFFLLLMAGGDKTAYKHLVMDVFK